MIGCIKTSLARIAAQHLDLLQIVHIDETFNRNNRPKHPSPSEQPRDAAGEDAGKHPKRKQSASETPGQDAIHRIKMHLFLFHVGLQQTLQVLVTREPAHTPVNPHRTGFARMIRAQRSHHRCGQPVRPKPLQCHGLHRGPDAQEEVIDPIHEPQSTREPSNQSEGPPG
ncbi:MAG: hypothetical protein EBU55_11310 [Betaproteobacteria bacterium]|nr:hypothetical protein [Betaproteobacteria bacterium]